jgi:hypothetical protein
MFIACSSPQSRNGVGHDLAICRTIIEADAAYFFASSTYRTIRFSTVFPVISNAEEAGNPHGASSFRN